MVKILSFSEQIKGIEESKGPIPKKEKKDPLKELRIRFIKEIAKRSLIELAVSLAFAGITCAFIATPVGMATVLICAVAAVAINILLRSAASYCKYRIHQLEFKNTPQALDKKMLFQAALGFLNYLVPAAFDSLVYTNAAVVVHEGGHALAAQALIKNPRVNVKVNPFEGGLTSYRFGALTKAGEFLGRSNSKLIIAAAGPVLAIATATVTFGTAIALRKKHPELSRYLKTTAIGDFIQHIFYAISALWTSSAQKSHDFVQLMAGGIHPVAAAVSMLAIPIIVRIGFFIYDKVKESMAEKAAKKAKQSNHEYMIQLPSNKFEKLQLAQAG